MSLSDSWLVYFNCTAYLDVESIEELNQLYTEDRELLTDADFSRKFELGLSYCPLTKQLRCVSVNGNLVIASGLNANFLLDHDTLTLTKLS